MRSFVVGQNEDGIKLARYVKRVTSGLPHPTLHKSFRKGRIKRNGHKAGADDRVAAGDVLELYLNDEYFETAPSPNAAAYHNQPEVQLVWQNEDLAALYKPPGLLSHATSPGTPSLLGAFTARMIAEGSYRPAEGGAFAPALCNRLDRGTEGLVIAAKHHRALRDMNHLIQLGLLGKFYLCITCGRPAEGEHTAWLQRNRTTKTSVVYAEEGENRVPIKTGVQVQEQKNGLCLCGVTLHTGRTHQIRAHLAYLGAPLAGDAKYGGACGGFARGQQLCAQSLSVASELPPNNSLLYLAGRHFHVPRPRVLDTWNTL